MDRIFNALVSMRGHDPVAVYISNVGAKKGEGR
jgi:hypothetical protein